MSDPVENSQEIGMSMFRSRDDMYAYMMAEINRLRRQLNTANGELVRMQEALEKLEAFPLTKLVDTNCTDVRAIWDTAAATQRRADLDWFRSSMEDDQ